MLTLCLARRYRPGLDQLSIHNDWHVLHNLYWRLRNDKIGSKAIAVMAISCLFKLPNLRALENEKRRVFGDFQSLFETAVKNNDVDIYTKALFLQATVSMDRPIDGNFLLKHQQSDGSFGDLLSTYYVIPALVNSSLVNLLERCQNKTFQKLNVPYLEDSRDASKIYYSVWIDSSTGKNIHSIEVTFTGNKTLFDIMKNAEPREETFKFQYDEANDGTKRLYSIANIPDDAERGKFWRLYVGYDARFYSLENFREETKGLNRIFPRNNEHFVFKLKAQ
ncbi:uncharacterized protein LOC129217639 [Uloborus diversus]|uniref:uncharacterized protein LOC129217639 n=1 Tax=Uloborus diversus TaxID=327109 RepID=UPI00240A72C2|nr:uncharacterized protein LOC129217639 [Uloborus diversus]